MTQTANTYQQFDRRQNLTLLKVYTAYRVVVCLVLLITYVTKPFENAVFGSSNQNLFFYGVIGYLAVNIITLIGVLPKTRQLNNQQLFISFFIDVLAVLILIDSSGGVRSGLEIILVVSVAASSIMLPSQIALLLAALASLGLLADTARLVHEELAGVANFLSAGLVGIVLFLTAFFIQNLASRIRGSQMLAEQHAADITKLQQLNQQIVQRMRTGILVCDQSGQILLANTAAGELLGDKHISRVSNIHPETIPDVLLTPLQLWQDSPQFRSPPLYVDKSDRELLVNFSSIENRRSADTLIFLEDNRRLVKQAQQMKLASLGRLTASIAHEIRNPLGAISHASQLLAESDQLDTADKRLCDIIQNHSARMNKVIENILHLSSRNASNPERLSLNDWIRRFIDEFQDDTGMDCTIRFESDDSAHYTFVDSSQLNQVLTNLTQNGLRYSQQRTGEATLLLKLYNHPTTSLPVMDIIDDGPGVAEQDIELIFEPFYTTDPKGSGLGLYISRELCEANEARLDYIAYDEGKHCFRISFPHPDRQPRPE